MIWVHPEWLWALLLLPLLVLLYIRYNKRCLLYTSPSPRDISGSRMPSSA